MSNPPKLDLSVYFVADPSLCHARDVVDVVALAVKGGVTMVQLRNKDALATNLAAQAEALLEITRRAAVPLIINDRADVARDVDADGVHLGQGDMPPFEARKILGPGKIIGLTAFDEEQIAAVDPKVVDYIGVGPFFETKTDKGKPVLGARRFRELAALSPVPVVGIGGITPDNAGDVIHSGAHGIAMMRSISEAEEPDKAAAELLNIVNSARLRDAS